MLDFYSEKYSDYSADLITCRHVLEHIDEPEAFMHSIRRSIKDPARTVVFFEVPNAAHTLRDLGIWDIIYEHVSYFTESSIARLFERSGFKVLRVAETYDGQFLTIEAVAVPDGEPVEETLFDTTALAQLATAFNEKYCQKVDYWTEAISKSGKGRQARRRLGRRLQRRDLPECRADRPCD